jgi:tetratricopeptide (TPR) repeat protein
MTFMDRRLFCLVSLVGIGLARPPRPLAAISHAEAGVGSPAESPGSSQNAPPSAVSRQDPQSLFEQGEAALKANDLAGAERCFRGVLVLDPQAASAYANLGVIDMRRRQWQRALEMLHKAQRLAPQMSGIQLDVGLVYYRQNDFQAAIAPFETVVKSAPDSLQARYLLGLCYFFTEQYAEAAAMLEPLWPEESNRLNYLYVLGIAAGKAKRPDLEDRALGRLVETGQNSAEFHLLMGKAHLNREEYDDALTELTAADKANPRLPFVHFNLGMVYMKKQDFERAKTEFLKDIAIEADVAYDYDQLGLIDYQQQLDQEAEKNLNRALRLDPALASSRFQLARVYQREGKHAQALSEIDAAGKRDPGNASIHYVRGQVLKSLGRTQEAQAEMQAFTRISNDARAQRQKELDPTAAPGPLPSPEVSGEPQ